LRRKRNTTFRLHLEALEERTMLSTVTWIGGSGDWSVASNWSTHTIPGGGDDAVIDVPGIRVTHSSGFDTVKSLSVNDPFTLSGGTLTVAGTVQEKSTPASFALSGGTLAGATVSSGTTITADNTGGNTLQGVIINGTLDMTGNSSARVLVLDGLTLNGTILLGSADGNNLGSLNFPGSEALSGNGSILFGGSDFDSLGISNSNTTLTIGPGLTLHGKSGSIGTSIGSAFINQGTISPDAAGGSFFLDGVGWSNQGTIQEAAGETVNFLGSWSNTGRISIGAGTLNLGGSFTTAGSGIFAPAAAANFSRNGGTVNLIGALDNTGATLALDARTGPWNLVAGGTITGGTITTAGGNDLVGIGGGGNTLSGVTLDGTLDVTSNYAAVVVANGMTLNGTILLGNADGSNSDSLGFSGSEALSGTGSILFGGSAFDSLFVVSSTTTVTLGPALTLHGKSGTIGTSGGGAFINQGTIGPDVAGGSFTVDGTGWSNQGTIQEAAGETVNFLGSWSNTGRISIGAGTLNLGGSFTTAGSGIFAPAPAGNFSRSGGTVNLIGALDNTGATLALDARTGPWNLVAGGTITGGTITTAGGNDLVGIGGGGNTLSGVTLNGTLDVASNDAGVSVANGMTLNGTILLGSADGTIVSTVLFVNTETVAGTGSILFGGSSFDSLAIVSSTTTVTFGPGLTLRGKSGTIGSVGGGAFINQATVTVEDDGQFRFAGTNWINAGTIQTDASVSTIVLTGSLTNTGIIQSSTGYIDLAGTLDNRGHTLALTDSTGSWQLEGGKILGGTVSTTGSARLIAFATLGNALPTLDGVTLAGALDMTTAGALDMTTGKPLLVLDGLTLNNGLISLSHGAVLSFQGTQILGGSGTVTLHNVWNGAGLAVPAAGDTLTIGQNIVVQGDSGSVGSKNGGAITNLGTISADACGDLTVQGLTNFSGGALTGGAWQATGGSTLRIIGANIVTNAASIVLDGAGSRILSDTGTTNALANLAAITTAGGLTVSGGASVTAGTGLTNAGTITVGTGSTLAAPDVTQTAGSTTLVGGTLNVTGPGGKITIQAGSLSGPGAIQGNLANSGQVDLGVAPGVLAVTGSFTQTASGSLALKIGGTTPGSQYDQIQVGGLASLGGTLNASLSGGFGPTALQVFNIITYAGSSGGFATVNLPLIGGIPAFLAQSTATSYNLVGTTTAADLAVDPASITVTPAPAITGRDVTVAFMVHNLGTITAAGSWVDSVYLAFGTTLSANDLLIGRTTHTGNVAGLSSYSASLSASLPAVTDGSYHIIVVADSRLQVPSANRANGTGVSAALPVHAQALTLGTPVTGTIQNGQELYYEVPVRPGQDVQLQGTFGAAQQARIFASRFSVPTPVAFDQADSNGPGQQQSLVLPGSQGGTYYILVQGLPGAGTGQTFSLLAGSAPLQITSFTSGPATTAGLTNLNLMGAGFTSQTRAQLRDASGATYSPTAVSVLGSSQLFATFDLSRVPVGTYFVQALQGSQTATAPTPFNNFSADQLVPAQVSISYPDAVKVVPYENSGYASNGVPVNYIAIIPVSITVSNPTSQPAYAPTLETIGGRLGVLPMPTPAEEAQAEQEGLGFASGYDINTQPEIFVASSTSSGTTLSAPGTGGLLPILAPGAKPNGLTVFFAVLDPTPHEIVHDGFAVLNGNTPVDWSGMKPDFLSADAWDAMIPNLEASMGTTYGSMQTVQMEDAAYLTQQGESVTSLNQVNALEFEKAENVIPKAILSASADLTIPAPGLALSLNRAFNNSIPGRYQLGSFGYGWSFLGDESVTADTTTGDVYIQQGGTVRVFVSLGQNLYQGAPGDTGKLVLANGSYVLTEADGTVVQFNPDGPNQWSFGSITDRDGNAIVATRNGSQLTLSSSSGTSLTCDDNAQGRITHVVSSTGQTVTYTYDSSGTELQTVTGPDGTVSYTYIMDTSNPARDHALASIRHLDGTHSYIGYDSQGRLTNAHGDNNTGSVTYAYLSPGGYTMTVDATKATTTVQFNETGLTTAVIDPMGNLYRYLYDSDGNPTATLLPDGTAVSTQYDPIGNQTFQVDPLGNTVAATYHQPFSMLASVQDANGNVTNYTDNSQGDLTQITAGDGSATNFVPNPTGEVQQLINARGQAISYAYNSLGEVTNEDFGIGVQTRFTYDDRGNLLTAADAHGTTTFEYADPAHPDLVTSITYPNGMFIAYHYDANGRLDQMNQNGYIVNYGYDSSGRLTTLTDSANAPIVAYTYDAANQLTRKDMGNGTYTTYAYFPSGQVKSLINYAPNGTVNSEFNYTYDALGRVQTVTSLDGTTTYGYDAASQLTSVASPDGQTIAYGYDAMGNRTTVTQDGVTTAYTTNNLNQYATVGAATYSYDQDGNLTVTTGPGGTTTYTYDVQDRLIGVQTLTETWAFSYDALGNIIGSSHNGQTTQYLVDPSGIGNVLGEYNGNGKLMANYTYGLGLTSQVNAAGAASYYDFNLTGSTVGLSGPAGSYLNSYGYLPFGEVMNAKETQANPFQYNGQSGVMSLRNGMVIMRARFYDAATGRFQTKDPSGIGGGIDLYEYVGNDSTNLIDPTGLGPPLPWQTLPGAGAPSYANGVNTISEPELARLATESYKDVIQAALRQEGTSFASYTRAAGAVENPVGARIAVGAAGLALGIAAGYGIAKLADAYDPGIMVWVGFGINSVLRGNSFGLIDFNPSIALPVGTTKLLSNTECLSSTDPNFLAGPAGYGPSRFVPRDTVLQYIIGFQNEPSATAPAQTVTVTQQLDPSLDWSTFQLGAFSIGDQVYPVPAGLTSYSTRIDATGTVGVYADVTGNLDEQTGVVTWTFTSIDPTTLDQPSGNPREGFLPPDNNPPLGEGWVSYSILPKAKDPTGTAIHAQASIVFDTNAAIDTAPFLNTIDAGAPSSSVAPLPATETSKTFTVNWAGADDPGGSGIARYDIFVSDDGGPFQPWLTGTTLTSTSFTGVVGHTYGFYSIATDEVGNREAAKTAAEASTLVVTEASTTTVVAVDDPNPTYGQSVTITATVSAIVAGTPEPTGTVQFQVDGVDFGAPVALNSGMATSESIATLGAGAHSISALYSGDANNTMSVARPLSLPVAQAPLTVAADNLDMAHGDSVPGLTWSISGFVNGDTISVIQGAPTLTTSASSTSAAGRYPITLAAGTLSAANYSFPNLVNGQLTVHPKVLDVRVDWGSQSMSILGLKRDLPFVNIKALEVIFSDDVNVDLRDLALTSTLTPGRSYSSSSFRYDPTAHDAQWTLPAALDVDKLLLALDGTNATLDGHDGIQVLPDIYLGNYSLPFAVLPGDFNGDGVVNSQDMVGIRNQIQGTGPPDLRIWADMDGTGTVDLNDYLAARKRLGRRFS
jgi:RHS repeat-associated protein